MKRSLAACALALTSLNLCAAALDPDTSFNSSANGRLQVYYDLGGGKSEATQDTAIAPTTGSIYTVGSVEIAPARASAALVKRLANGAPDTAFAAGSYSNSWIRIDSVNATGAAQFNAVAFDGTNTGAVFAAGFRDIASGQRCAYAVKVLDNGVVKGALDGGFANQGSLTYCDGYGKPMSFSDVKVLPDGKILLLWNGSINGGSETGGALIRLLVNGQFDTSFNAGGLSGFQGQYNIDVRSGKNESADRIAVTSAGYLVGGSSQYAGNDWDGFVVRVLANGTRDTGFNGGTRFEALDDANTAKEDRLADLVADTSGRAVLLMNSNNQFVRVVRLTTGGARDTGFNGTGLQLAALADTTGSSSGNYSYTFGAALALNSAQQIWVTGSLVYVSTNAPNTSVLAVSRLAPSGAVLNYNGLLPYGQTEYGATATVGTDNRLLLGSRLRTSGTSTDFDFGFVRLLGTP
jgi:Domain of unknown function (DUF5122) beta-propeller